MAIYDALARSILKNIGGASNIDSLTHCITRLRVVVKDDSKVRVDGLNAIEGVAGTLKSYGQYMIIIGTNVPDVYDAVCKAAGIKTVNDAGTQKENHVKQTLFQRFVGLMTYVFAPFFGVIAACGMLKGLLSLLVMLGTLDAAGSTYNILYSLADSFFYYMPILLAYTASKRFGLPVPEGLVIGAGMLYPNLLASSAAVHDSLLSIPVIMPPGDSYASTAIPIVAAVAFAAWFERKYEKYVPDGIKPFAVPLITCPITFMLTLWVIGPVTAGVTNVLAFLLNRLESMSHIVFSGLLGAIWQLVLMVGLHWAVLPLIITNLSTVGYDTTLSSTFGCNFAQIGAALAVMARTKDRDTKKICGSSVLPAAVGVIEPALYGVSLRRRTVFIITCVVSSITGIGMNLTGLRAYRFAGFGVFGYAAYADPTMNDSRGMMLAILWSLFALVLSFALVWLFYKEDTGKKNAKENVPEQTEAPTQKTEAMVKVPLDGTLLSIQKMDDPVFSNETLGKGCAIEPTGDKVTAPFDGVIDLVADTKHAVGLTSVDGIQLLIHVGIDTVALNGKGFEPKVSVGQKVKQGDELLRFDRSVITDAGYKATTAVVVLNTDDYSDVRLAEKEGTVVSRNQNVLEILP